jgi:glycosyltransferase involved in cell wall biosynthesis
MPSVLHVLPHPGGGGERYIELLAAMPGYNHDRDWLSSRRAPLSALPSILARYRGLKREAARHELLHLHGDMASMLALSLYKHRPAVITTHGLSFLRRARGSALQIARARWHQVSASAARIICSSQAEYDELLPLSAPGSDRLVVIPNGIPPVRPLSPAARHAARAALGLGSDELACLYVGLLDRNKDPLTAVRAVLAMRRDGLPATLLVAGDGPLLGTVRAHHGPAVRALGFRADLEPLLAAADVFVMPSRREGSSFALLEAMARGLAVVGSDGPGVAETIGDAGLIAPVGDSDAFARRLRELILDPARRQRLGSAARERVTSRHGIERFIEQTREAYVAALGDPGRRVPASRAGRA